MPRKRSPHPGIVRLPARPEKRQAESIRYKDPDSGKTRTERIPEFLSEAQVSDWLRRRAQDLVIRRRALELGAARASGITLVSAIDDYYRESTIADTTSAMYRFSTALLLEWASARRPPVVTGDALTLAELRDLRAWLVTARGIRSPHSVNRDLRTIACVLEHSRKAGRCARLTRDAIADGLERLRAPVELGEFLSPGEIRRLIVAAREHEPEAAPVIEFLILAGCRKGVAVGLRRRDVRPDVGVIEVPAALDKSRRGYAIDLGVSPALRAMVEMLRPGQLAPTGPKAGSRIPAVSSTYDPLFTLTLDQLRESQRRLAEVPGVPDWTPHTLRRTCGTYLVCAPSIFGAASVYMAARQLNHSVEVAQKHYLGRIKISPEAKTLEAAMGIAGLF